VQPGRSRVVVIGASLAGLFAAAAAAEQADPILVVERDRVPATPTPRRGVPQGSHQHVLLHRGLIAAEQLLPGLREDLVRAGAVPIDTGDLLWLGPSGWSVPGGREFEILAATRPLLEHVVRSRVTALPHVELCDDTEVRRLCVDAGRVTGVELRNGGHERADLVVDASGRNSHLPAWLRAAGLPSPDEQVVDACIGYASRLYRADRSWFAGAGLFILATPDTPTGASVLPVEDGRWLVTAVGLGERRPPRDEPGFHTFLTELRDPAVADFVTRATPAGPISWHRQTANHRRRYERTRPWPRGLLVVGDALCAFNPIYGHGITVAALQALELRAALTATAPADVGRRLLLRVARRAALPWSIATSEDLRYRTSDGRPGLVQAQLGRYTHALDNLAAHGNTHARRSTAAVYHLMAPPARLLHPALLAATARDALLGHAAPVERPTALTTPTRPASPLHG
jgi:2-polyprenyl-6-methoxyphenol hydroxylase-like FAD-dependent oxidoreductase